MRVFNLSSGSDGNATYLETESTKILIDDGISCAETLKRLSLIGVKGEDIDAVIITHEHSDHMKGLDVFSKKFHTPIYAHNDVWKGLYPKLTRASEENMRIFTDNFQIGELEIAPVEIPHDVKCFGFSFYEGDKKVSVLTDLGHTNDKIFNSVKGSQLIYLEANHDLSMLRACEKYPLSLKMRIAGKNGHLSNDASADFAKKLVESGTRQIVLSHLSKENNTPDLAYTYISSKLSDNGIVEGVHVRIDVASTIPTRIFRLK